VNDVPRTIVGVMPPRFAYPARQVEIWLPLSLDPARTHPATFNLVGIGAPVLLFALGITVFCALFVSVLPLLRARRVSLAQLLRGASAGASSSRPHQRARDTLVVAQIALALVLVASSMLMTRSFLRLIDVHPGFDADRVVTSRVLLPFARYSGATSRLNFLEVMVHQAQAIPGARDVALTDWVPLSGDHHDMAIDVEDEPSRSSSSGADHAVASVDGRYFQTLRIPLLRGRTFDAPDAASPSNEVIVSRAFAERYWPGASPIGKRLRPLGGRWYTVVGEVGDVHYDALDQPANEIVYFPIVTAAREGANAVTPGALSLVVRTESQEGETLSAIRNIVRTLDAAVPTYDEGSLHEVVYDASARTRTLVVLLAVASIVTLLLGAVGLYGITAYAVSIRRRELGIRMALGARPVDVSRMVSLHGLRLATLGIVIGLACTLAASRLLRALLYGVSPTDPVTLSVTPVALLVVAFIASWMAARRAAGVEPAEALRAQ
jgi:predicted permease